MYMHKRAAASAAKDNPGAAEPQAGPAALELVRVNCGAPSVLAWGERPAK